MPKSLYVSGAFTEREGDPLSEDSIYRSVSLGKGQVCETFIFLIGRRLTHFAVMQVIIYLCTKTCPNNRLYGNTSTVCMLH